MFLFYCFVHEQFFNLIEFNILTQKAISSEGIWCYAGDGSNSNSNSWPTDVERQLIPASGGTYCCHGSMRFDSPNCVSSLDAGLYFPLGPALSDFVQCSPLLDRIWCYVLGATVTHPGYCRAFDPGPLFCPRMESWTICYQQTRSLKLTASCYRVRDICTGSLGRPWNVNVTESDFIFRFYCLLVFRKMSSSLS